VNDALKKNEDILKKSLSEYEVTVKTVENKYELLKSHATSQLEKWVTLPYWLHAIGSAAGDNFINNIYDRFSELIKN
jgi:hypothetical protein